MADFIKGKELSKQYYFEIVEKIIEENYPTLNYTACFLGYGSDVIGYDDEISRDHMWGPRLKMFLSEGDYASLSGEIQNLLSEELPYSFLGYPTNFSIPDVNDGGVQRLEESNSGKVNHLIEIKTINQYLKDYIGLSDHNKISDFDWLTFCEHRLLALTSGEVFHDDLNINDIREKLRYYPDDIRYYMISSLWSIISEEEAFIGRTGAVDDDLGSRIITTRIVNMLMRICFAIERKYAPYSKWFGTAFKQLDIYSHLNPLLMAVLDCKIWKERELLLCKTFSKINSFYFDQKMILEIEIKIQGYYGRPYQVAFVDDISDVFNGLINNNALRNLDRIGTLNIMTNISGIFDEVQLKNKFKALYNHE